jgi:hypothetical protein
MKKYIATTVLLLILFLVALLIGYFTTDKVVNRISYDVADDRIMFIDSFPETDEAIVIGSILKMVSSESFIYLLDQNRSFIHQFDLNGNYLNQISSVGPGPGELQQPLSISFDSGLLYTFEQTKMQVQAFEESGEYVDVYLFQGAYEDITVLNNSIWFTNYYFPGLPNFVDMPESDNQPIYTVYDIVSGSLSAAGSYPDLMRDRDKIGTVRTAKYDDEIYALLRRMYEINVYDSGTGELVRTIQLQGGMFNDLRSAVQEDYENLQLPLMNVVVNRFGIFIPAYGEELTVYGFNFDGHLKTSISFSNHYETEYDDRYIRHIHIKELDNSNRLRFYLKVYSDFPRVLIFDKEISPL